MINKFVLRSSLETIENYFNVKSVISKSWNSKNIVAPGETTPIITQQNPEELMLSTFGMTPSWAKHPMDILNARAEGDKNPGNDPAYRGSKAIFLKPAFQKSLFSQRCIIVADAFIEWSADIQHQPFLFFLRHQERPFGFAGLFDLWQNPVTKDYLHSFSIITVPANSLIRKIKVARMPMILPRGKETRWLKPDNSLTDILNFLIKYPSDLMNAYPINKNINRNEPFNKDTLLPKGDNLLQENETLALPRQNHYHSKKSDVSHWLGNKPI